MMTALLMAGLLCVGTAVVSAIRLARALERRGVRTPPLLIGPYVFRNLELYSRITREETGRIGSLFWTYVVPINAALVIALVAVLHGAAH